MSANDRNRTFLTKQLISWLELPQNKPQIERLVQEWNKRNLLGSDLADSLHKLIQDKAEQAGYDGQLDGMLALIDWNHIAGAVALKYAGVDEAQLKQRRLDLEKSLLQ